MANAIVIDRAKGEPHLNLARCMLLAYRTCGKRLSSQLSEIAKLSFGNGKLKPEEYYYYGLYDDREYSFSAKARFIGKRAQDKIHRRCNDLGWWGVAHDKMIFYPLLAGLGFAVPEVYAVYHGSRSFGSVPTLRTADALAAHLRRGMSYPFFSKPVAGMYSVGVAAVEDYDAASDSLTLADGRSVGVADFVAELSAFEKDGYLFQERLDPHPDIQAVCGDRAATVRVMVLFDDGGPRIVHAVWKIPVGANIADNFWREGNMLGAVEVETGRVVRVVRGVGPDRETVDTHPDTAKAVKGVELPDWPRLRELCLSVASVFPGLRIQAWDIALCADGPVPLEVNIGGDFNLPQLASGSGLLDEDFRAFLAAKGKG